MRVKESIAEQTENRSSDATLQQNDDNVDLTHKDATTKAQSQSQEKEVYNSETSSKNINDSADKRQTEI